RGGSAVSVAVCNLPLAEPKVCFMPYPLQPIRGAEVPTPARPADQRLPLDVTFSVFASQIKSVFVTDARPDRSRAVPLAERNCDRSRERCVDAM
ncbi:hypothetical protein JTP77_038405, partial [Streptomyces sp. S9]|nr:hypothetical protein [Streptomyces sp. S9]